MNTLNNYNNNSYKRSQKRTVPETKPMTLDPKLSIIRGAYWVIIAAVFVIMLSTQEAQGKPFFNMVAAQEIVKSGVRIICEPSTLLLNSAHIEKAKNQTSFYKVKKLLNSEKLNPLNGQIGALTLSEKSEMADIKKEHHLHNVSVDDLEKINQEMNNYGLAEGNKSFFDIMFGTSEKSNITPIEDSPITASDETKTKDLSSPQF